ncbi:MAG: Clp protease/crotonase-like domain-containing protein, partial [Planctomycetota bacterium]
MNNSHGKTAIFVLCLLLSAAVTWAVEAETAEGISPSSKAAIIICKGDIDNGLYRSIVRRTNIAIEQGCKYLIYEIDTYGGDLFSADDISDYFLLEINEQAHTVAYVSKKAI